jgi:hypothetical protein
MTDPNDDAEVLLARFNRLMQELLRGHLSRNCFRPWEVDLLLDIETCDLRESNKRDTLKRYQRFVQRQMERGAPRPARLSEYLSGLRARRESVAATPVTAG